MSVQPAENSERTKPEKNLMVPETGIEPVRPLAGKRRILRVMRPFENLVLETLLRLLNFTDQRFDQRLQSYHKSNKNSIYCVE